MADDLDDLLRNAMTGLSRQAPVGYFDALPGRVLARLDGPELDELVAEEAVTEDEVIGEREEHSGLQDIRNLANETKARLARQSQAPSAREDRLASSSAGWRVVALPDPAARTSGPIAMPVGVAAAPPVPVLGAADRIAVGAVEGGSVGDAPRAASPVIIAATSVGASPQVSGRANRRRRVAILGAGLAVAAGAVIVVTRPSAEPASPRAVATAERAAPVERAAPAGAADRAASAPAASATPTGEGPVARGTPAAVPPAPASVDGPVAKADPTDPSAPTAGPGGGASTDDGFGKRGSISKATVPARRAGKRGDLDEPPVASNTGTGVGIKKPAAKPEAKDVPGLGGAKRPPAAKGGVPDPDAAKPDAPAGQAPLEPRAGGRADLVEPSFDELAKEAGVVPAKPAAPRLARTSLSADDIKRALTLVAPRAKACFNGTEGTAAVQLTVAPSGKISKVVITGVFAGTPTAACVERAVRSTSFPPWDGGPQSVGYSYLLSE